MNIPCTKPKHHTKTDPLTLFARSGLRFTTITTPTCTWGVMGWAHTTAINELMVIMSEATSERLAAIESVLAAKTLPTVQGEDVIGAIEAIFKEIEAMPERQLLGNAEYWDAVESIYRAADTEKLMRLTMPTAPARRETGGT